MNDDIKYYVGIDPGLGGGYAIISQDNLSNISAKVFGVPIIKTKATKTSKAKNEYDVRLIAKNLEEYKNKSVKVCLEKVSAMPNQGTVSMFHFGEGFGIWKGIIQTLGFELQLVSPMTWKSFWPEKLLKKLEKPEMLKLKQVEINRLSATDRKIFKNIKLDYQHAQNDAKKLAKDQARDLARLLYPDLAESFKLKKDDGKAEAILIAEYIRRKDNGE